jgi:Bacterial archaeo-eukaryotic release factor family 7
MKLFSIDELAILTAEGNTNCVSIYMPTYKMSTETLQNPIRFKNLMREAEEKLIANGMRPQDARDLLLPAQELDEYDFWQHQSNGLAIFISKHLFSYYTVPIDFLELVVVTDRFHLKPLISLLTGDGQFYILALSQNLVRLFQGTRYSISEIELEDVPTSMAEALKYDDPEKSLQFHTGTPQGGSGSRAAIFHGHGAGNDDEKENILRYFRCVDKGLQELLKGQKAYLVLAGVDYLLPIYKQANSYSNLIDEGVTGNPDQLKAEELHAQAWQIVQPYFEAAQDEAIAYYKANLGTGKTANTIQEVVLAAYYQRIESLFVPLGQQKWGMFNSETSNLEIHSEQEAGDEDLMDLAALHTILNGGTVYAVTSEKVPGNAKLAAILRY